MAVKTWFITGTSRGFGREWAIAALDRGDRVAATARDIASLDDLAATYGDAILPIRLDVTDRAADFAAVKLAHDYFGRLDVVVNNAGYGQFGMVEEISESEIRAELETPYIEEATPLAGGRAVTTNSGWSIVALEDASDMASLGGLLRASYDRLKRARSGNGVVAETG